MIRVWHWLLMGVIAVALHGALLFGLALSSKPTEGAEDKGEQGIKIDLGMLGDVGKAQAAAQAEIAPPPQPEPEIKPPPKPQAPPAEPEPVKPAPAPEPPPVVPPKQKPPVKVKPKPKPQPKPKPEQKPKPKPKPQAKPEPKPQPKPQPQAPTEPASMQPQTSAHQTQPASSSVKDSAVAQTRAAGQAGQSRSAKAADSGGNPGAKPSYFGKLAAILARHKRYPKPSERRKEEGVVTLSFVINRSGQVLSSRISKSSGYPRLDEAVLNMLEQAQPLPAFPPEITQSQLEVRLPISFKLNT